MNKVIVDLVFLRKHYCRELLEQMFRDNVTHLYIGKNGQRARSGNPWCSAHGAHLRRSQLSSGRRGKVQRHISDLCSQSAVVTQTLPCVSFEMAKFSSFFPKHWNSVPLSYEGSAVCVCIQKQVDSPFSILHLKCR